MITELPSAAHRVAVIGDIGGQAEVLRRCLDDLGLDRRTNRLPADLTVVQVGDLTRIRGDLDNAGCLDIVDRVRAANPGRWVQLLGNHDLALIGGPRPARWPSPEQDDPRLADRLRAWWTDGDAQLALALDTDEFGPVLLAHAGLTRGRWRRLGTPADPARAAHLINADAGRPAGAVIHGGRLSGVDSGPDGERADVAWAEVNNELYGPWIAGGDAPFTQIHGHASPWNWAGDDWWPDATPDIRTATRLDRDVRRTVTALNADAIAISVDWMLGNEPTTAAWPLLIMEIRIQTGAVES